MDIKNKIDLTKDTGFEVLASLDLEIPGDTDIDLLIEKQAYAEDNTFADPQDRMFSTASKVETELSLRYAEKCASQLLPPVLDNLNEAAAMYGLRELRPEATEKQANEMFPEAEEGVEKYAGVVEYGTELENALYARASLCPDEAEEILKIAELKAELKPQELVEVIKLADSELGLDLPWVQSRIGSPEYAVYEKRANLIEVDLGTKQVSFEKLAEIGDMINDMGISIDFDENDPYTTKLAIERLPKMVKEAIAKYLS